MIPPAYRIMEVCVYALLNFLPLMLVAITPFQKHLRFSVAMTVFLSAMVCIFQVLIGCLASFSNIPSGLLSIVSTLVYAASYFLIVKFHFGKLAFTLLMLSNIANFTVVSSKCMEGLIFKDLALEPYRFSASVCLAAVHIIVTLPLFYYFRHVYTRSIIIETKSGFWRYMWTIPAIFYIVWYHLMYLSGMSSLEISLMPGNTLFLLVLNLGAFSIYHLVMRLVEFHEKAIVLERQAHQLTMQKLQYDNLNDRINEIRRAKHDLHHHVHLLQDYLRERKLDELEAYLNHYQASLPIEQPLFYCRHFATNALLGYFAQHAQAQDISMNIQVDLPEHVPIPETDLSVVLGNLLENAINACGKAEGIERRITVRGVSQPSAIFFEIINNYAAPLKQDDRGKLLSTKSKSHGLGLDSVSAIVKNHNGMMEIDTSDQQFRVSVLLVTS